MTRGKLALLLGPSGVGKTTILRKLETRGFASHPEYTDRPSRGTLDDEMDFIFQPKARWPFTGLLTFDSYGNSFGIQIDAIERDLEIGNSCALVVGDRDTVTKLRKALSASVFVFMIFCERDALLDRLRQGDHRGGRIAAVEDELMNIYDALGCVDFLIDNTDDSDAAAARITQIARSPLNFD